MSITRKDVEHVARLARLTLTEEEKDTFAVQLSNILSHVEQLSTVDTSNVEPTSHVLEISNVWREDKIVQSPPREEILSNAPDTDGSFYRVPKIIE